MVLLILVGLCVAETSTGADATESGGMAEMYVDVNPDSNANSSMGTRDDCTGVTAGETVTVDIIASGVPAAAPMIAFSFVLEYDDTILTVLTSDSSQMLAANPGSDIVDVSDLTPDTEVGGTFAVLVADLGTGVVGAEEPESGSGVLTRMQVIVDDEATGAFPLRISGNGAATHVDPLNDSHAPNLISDAVLVVGDMGTNCNDDDGDFVSNAVDICPLVPNHEQVDAEGDRIGDACDPDDDGDGVCDYGTVNPACTSSDLCPDSEALPVDLNGCSWAQVDADLDGACDPAVSSMWCEGTDVCPLTPEYASVDTNGCLQEQVDEDLDGVCDLGATSTLCQGEDSCPGTPPMFWGTHPRLIQRDARLSKSMETGMEYVTLVSSRNGARDRTRAPTRSSRTLGTSTRTGALGSKWTKTGIIFATRA